MGYLQWSCSVTTGYWSTARYEYVNVWNLFPLWNVSPRALLWILLSKPAYSSKTETVYRRFLQECNNKLSVYDRYFVIGRSNCQCTQQKGVHLLPITHTNTHRYDIFWPGMCLQCICSDNQVFSQGFLMCSEQYKAIIFRSELLHDPM